MFCLGITAPCIKYQCCESSICCQSLNQQCWHTTCILERHICKHKHWDSNIVRHCPHPLLPSLQVNYECCTCCCLVFLQFHPLCSMCTSRTLSRPSCSKTNCYCKKDTYYIVCLKSLLVRTQRSNHKPTLIKLRPVMPERNVSYLKEETHCNDAHLPLVIFICVVGACLEPPCCALSRLDIWMHRSDDMAQTPLQTTQTIPSSVICCFYSFTVPLASNHVDMSSFKWWPATHTCMIRVKCNFWARMACKTFCCRYSICAHIHLYTLISMPQRHSDWAICLPKAVFSRSARKTLRRYLPVPHRIPFSAS